MICIRSCWKALWRGEVSSPGQKQAEQLVQHNDWEQTGWLDNSQQLLELPVENEGWSYSHQRLWAKSDKEIKSLKMITPSVVVAVHQMCQVRLLCLMMNDADQTLAWARWRPGGKGERMRTTQSGSSRVDKMDCLIYLRNFTTQDSNRSLYRDLKEDVAGTRGHRSSETVMRRHGKNQATQ